MASGRWSAVPHAQLSIDVRPDRERVILVPHGDLDHFTAPQLRAAVAEVITAGWREVVLDLRNLEFMDSGGIHLLEELRDGALGDANYRMVDGVGPVALPLRLIGAPALLPAAEVAG